MKKQKMSDKPRGEMDSEQERESHEREIEAREEREAWRAKACKRLRVSRGYREEEENAVRKTLTPQ